MKTEKELQAYIDRLSKEYDSIIVRHGHGVRPSYVSSDLACLSERIGRARKDLTMMDKENT